MQRDIHCRLRFSQKSISQFCVLVISCPRSPTRWLCLLFVNPNQRRSSQAHREQVISKCLSPSVCMDPVNCTSFSLTIDGCDDTISPAWYGRLHAAAYHIADTESAMPDAPIV